MSSVLGEPIWKNAPRYCATMRLPAYRYLPGKNLHPDNNHLPALTRDNAFLYGIDLYHAGYFYEAHEAWEYLWLILPKDDLRRTLFHGLIQLTAALLKCELAQFKPAQRLSRRALHYIEIVQHHEPTCEGIDLASLCMQIQKYFQPLWSKGVSSKSIDISKAPRLVKQLSHKPI